MLQSRTVTESDAASAGVLVASYNPKPALIRKLANCHLLVFYRVFLMIGRHSNVCGRRLVSHHRCSLWQREKGNAWVYLRQAAQSNASLQERPRVRGFHSGTGYPRN